MFWRGIVDGDVIAVMARLAGIAGAFAEAEWRR